MKWRSIVDIQSQELSTTNIENMPRKPAVHVDDEFDYHVPLYDRKEFKHYALKIVLPLINKTPMSRGAVKRKLEKKRKLDPFWNEALAFLVLHDKIRGEWRGLITYFSLKTVTAAPKAAVEASERVTLRYGYRETACARK